MKQISNTAKKNSSSGLLKKHKLWVLHFIIRIIWTFWTIKKQKITNSKNVYSNGNIGKLHL